MNNKFVYSLILFLILSLEASEKQKVAYDKKIEASIHLSGGRGIDCEIIEIRDALMSCDVKLNNATVKSFNAVEISEWFDSSTRIAGVVRSKCRQAATGVDISIFIKGESVLCFEKKIKESYDIYKKNNNYPGDFDVRFLNKKNTSDIISLCLSKEQVEKIIKKPSVTTSITSIILVGLGVAGFIAFLVYYFNLHSKYIPLSQRS